MAWQTERGALCSGPSSVVETLAPVVPAATRGTIVPGAGIRDTKVVATHAGAAEVFLATVTLLTRLGPH